MALQFFTTMALLCLILGALLAFGGIWAFWRYRKNGALFLGTIMVLVGTLLLYILHRASAAV